jgi:ABC-type Fe3+-hydroxamate transport system substrate-binding protein
VVKPRLAAALVAVSAALAAAFPQRIVSTAPSITEMLYALGLGDRVVGVTIYAHYPPEARLKPKIGSYIAPNLERIAATRPDLVIIQNNPIHLGERLAALHLNVVEVRQDSIAEIYRSIQTIGDAAGVPDRARALNRKLEQEIRAVRERTAGFPPTRMMFVVGRTPDRLEDIICVGKASYLNGIMTVAGGENIFKDAIAPYPKVGLEEILARNPQVIVDMGDMSQTDGVTEAHKQAVIRLWSQFPTIDAVKNHRVFAVASDIFIVPGPRMVDAARAFARMLHPGAVP